MGEIIVGIDIGTSKVCTIIGRVDKSNQIEVLGIGTSNCEGVKKGIIVDIESTSNSIRTAVEKAEKMSNIKVGSAYFNIMGAHVNVISNRTAISVSNENREIRAKDVEKVLYTAGDVAVPEDQQVIDVIPRQYIVDGYDEILDPIGMVGVKLEIDADVVTGKITSVQNIVKSAERAGVDVDGLVVGALAAGELLLTPDEKDMGVVLIDVGGGITDISVFKNKKLIFNDSIPVGGDHITNDISIGLKISYPEAEKIKKQYELALTSLIKNDQEITVTDTGENRKKTVRVSEVVEIIEARVYEIFQLCRNLLEKAGVFEEYGAGVVITGGGISYVDGNKQLAGEAFDLPVRVAFFRHQEVSKPEFWTSFGILKFISNYRRGRGQGSEVKVQKPKVSKADSGFFSKIIKMIKDFFF